MRTALLATLLVALGATALGRGGVRVIDDKPIAMKSMFAAKPAVEVGNLRFYACENIDTGAPCTVVSGQCVSRFATPNFKITITIQFFGVDKPWPGDSIDGSMTVTLLNPAPGKVVKFIAVGPPVYKPGHHDGVDRFPAYTLAVTATQHSVHQNQ